MDICWAESKFNQAALLNRWTLVGRDWGMSCQQPKPGNWKDVPCILTVASFFNSSGCSSFHCFLSPEENLLLFWFECYKVTDPCRRFHNPLFLLVLLPCPFHISLPDSSLYFYPLTPVTLLHVTCALLPYPPVPQNVFLLVPFPLSWALFKYMLLYLSIHCCPHFVRKEFHSLMNNPVFINQAL